MQEGKTSSYAHTLAVPRTRGVPAVSDTLSTPTAALCLPDGENCTLYVLGEGWFLGEGAWGWLLSAGELVFSKRHEELQPVSDDL